MMTPNHPSTIGDVLRRSARRVPHAIALRFGDRSWTYRALDEATDRVAHHLRALGLVKGDRVAAFGKNSDAYLMLWLGVVKAGLVHVPINYALTGGELGYIVGQSGARAIFVDPTLRAEYDASPVHPAIVGSLRGGTDAQKDILSWANETEKIAFAAFAADELAVADTDIAQLLYTSGTTAAPKGAILTHRALLHHYASSVMACDMKAADRQLHALPLYHSAQMHVFMMPALMLGGENYLVESPDLAVCLDLVAAHRLNVMFAPPTVWVAMLALLEKSTAKAASLEKAFYGASIMPVPVLQALRALLPNLQFYNVFGQSEIGPLATVLRPEEHDARPASAGRAIPFVDMRVVDDEMNDVLPGEVGEVVYQSPQLCLGYWNLPDETAEAFAGGWFHSGDLARIDEEGYITIVDRKKDVIKTGGIQVSSREVEEAIFTHPAVREVAVVPVAHPKWIEAITAVIVLREDASATEDEIIEHARQSLAPFKLPKQVVFVPSLPKTTSGKLLKRVLRDELAKK